MSSQRYRNPWQSVAENLRGVVASKYETYEKDALPHPREVGARVSASFSEGQIADYRFGPETRCAGLHVQEHEHHWRACMDPAGPDYLFSGYSPDKAISPWLGCALIGAAAGAALGRKGGAVLVGAGIGLLVAALISSEDGE